MFEDVWNTLSEDERNEITRGWIEEYRKQEEEVARSAETKQQCMDEAEGATKQLKYDLLYAYYPDQIMKAIPFIIAEYLLALDIGHELKIAKLNSIVTDSENMLDKMIENGIKNNNNLNKKSAKGRI